MEFQFEKPKDINITSVSGELDWKDLLGVLKMRLGIGRDSYEVSPGLYSIGSPEDSSPVLVTSNYKMTFDLLRKYANGINAYILVLDTGGINVWCAAGKGSFNTEELISRIFATKLSIITKNRTLVLPQLGASHMRAHEVKSRTGFKVVYGPVHLSHLKPFIENGMQKTKAMTRVRFTLFDRAVLTPIEFIGALKIALPVLGAMYLMQSTSMFDFGSLEAMTYIGAITVSTVVFPLILPLIPVRSFALSGALLGLAWAFLAIKMFPYTGYIKMLSICLLSSSISSWYALNFTGAVTFTSQSGVEKEMRIALPIINSALITGSVLLLISSQRWF